jgi:hypothetical protein
MDDLPNPVATPLSRFSQLTIEIRTGGDDLRVNNRARLSVLDTSGTVVHTCELNGGGAWGGGSSHTVVCPLPSLPATRGLGGFQLTHDPNSKQFETDTQDNWDVEEIAISALEGGSSVRLLQRRGTPFVRLTGALPSMRMHSWPALDGFPVIGFRVETFVTGDDLAESAPATATFRFDNGLVHRVPLNGGRGIPGGTVVNDVFRLSELGFRGLPFLTVDSLQSITVEIRGSDPVYVRDGLLRTFDNTTARVNVHLLTTAGDAFREVERPFLVGVRPELRFTSKERSVEIYRRIPRIDTRKNAAGLRVTYSTRDRETAAADLTFIATFSDGTSTFAKASPGPGAIREGATHKLYVPFGRERDIWTMTSLIVRARSPVTLDLLAIEAVQDPVKVWTETYKEAQRLLPHSGAIALGTDLNGLAEQIPFTLQSVAYPFSPADVAMRSDPSGVAAASLDLESAGTRRFDVRADGIAHVGMLPDFAAAAHLASRDGGDSVGPHLYRSAEAFVQMWERMLLPGTCGRPLPDGFVPKLDDPQLGTVPGVSVR